MDLLTAILAAGVAAGYFTIAALVVPRIDLTDATRRFVAIFRVGGIAFFVGCGLTHTHIAFHALADDDEVGTHELVFHLLQVFGVWMFIYGALRFLDVRVQRRKTAFEIEAEALQARIDDLSRSNRDLEQFAHVVAHDLQAPLRTTSGLAQMLQTRFAGQLDPAADEVVERIVGGNERMGELLDGVLAYSQVAGRGLERARVDLSELFRECEQALAAEIEARGAVLQAGPLPTVVGDRVQLGQLLQNLLANALKFGDAGAPRITVEAVRSDGEWEVSVADNGIGIDPAHSQRIFGMFERVDTGDAPGTGLGLALAEKIVERHGGRIWVEPRPEGGSVFRFTLPAG